MSETLSQRRERPEPKREKPILFSGPMVRAVLEGKKTQTRRVVKVRKPSDHLVLASPMAVTLCPYGQPGDLLWVRETWGPCAGGVVYRASEDPAACPDGGKWKPSIFMPRWASRITLEVTGVRVERLQDISEEDAKAEGVEYSDAPFTHGFRNYGPEELEREQVSYCATARESFESLWDSINGDGANWAANPWVWVVEFRRATP